MVCMTAAAQSEDAVVGSSCLEFEEDDQKVVFPIEDCIGQETPEDFLLDAYYIHYTGILPKDESFVLLERLKNGEKYTVRQEWIQSMNDSSEARNLFLSCLFLTYWKHPESRMQIMEFTENKLCNYPPFYALSETNLALILYFAAYDAAFVKLAISILEKAQYDPNTYIEGYHLLAWCILADYPEMLKLLIRKGGMQMPGPFADDG